MFKLFKQKTDKTIHDFKGGIHPPEMKSQSNSIPLAHLPLPERLIIPLRQHIGHDGELLVKVGDSVLRGQALTSGTGKMLPVHASTSGLVRSIGPHITAHPSGLPETCVFITPDGYDQWIPLTPLADYQNYDRSLLIERLHQFGVAGLGGAGFPTATKLRGGLKRIKTLIINAAECEPYITADDRLMRDYAAEVIIGCRLLGWIIQAESILIGIEDNKPEAIAALRAALQPDNDMMIKVIPTKYPSGGAKQLTQILTGRQVPHGGRSSDIGVLMHNVGTAWAVKRAIIDGEPLTERVVTLTGDAIKTPRNVWARLGTPAAYLLAQAGFTADNQTMVIMGGPLMGFTLHSLQVPVVKITNCLLAPSATEITEPEQEQACIRCSACADACPAGLLPQQLYWYCQGGDHDKARAYHLNDCIECGACAYVCPSNIPLVQYYRQEKAELLELDLQAKRTAEAKARYEARQARLESEKQARQNKHLQSKVRAGLSAQQQQHLNDATERARLKGYDPEGIIIEAGVTPDNSQAIATRAARKAEARQQRARRTATEAMDATHNRASVEPEYHRSLSEEVVITNDDFNSVSGLSDPAEDPRKAAVAAAIARAKARKAAQPTADPAADDSVQAECDPRKAAVAAAIARAKARKAQLVQTDQLTPESQTTPLSYQEPNSKWHSE